jgi:sodium transport system permease protein
MIRPAAVLTLYKKELLEVVRDRRALFLTVVFPLILYPTIFLVASQVAMKSLSDIEAESAVALVVPSPPPSLLGHVKADDNVSLRASPTVEGALASLRAGEAAAVVDLTGLADAASAADEGTVTAHVHFDSTSEVSARVRTQVQGYLTALRDERLAERLTRRHLPETFARPLAVESDDIAPPAAVGGHLLGKIAPLLIIMMIALGAFYPAIEVTVGEKERGTLQTLLTAPVTSLEIVTGKFLSVFTVALLAGAANILSMGLLALLATTLPGELSGAMALDLNFVQVLVLLAVIGLVGLLVAAVMMAIATLARTNKEAQAWMTPVYLLCVLPPMLSQIPGLNLDGGLQGVPLLGHALLMRELLEGTVHGGHIFGVFVASLLFTAAALVLAARIFQHESTVLGDVAFFGPAAPGERRPIPTAGDAVALLTLVFILIFYGGSLLQSWHMLAGVALTQWLLLLVPCVAFLRWQRADLRAALGLRLPRPAFVVSAVLLGAAAWYPVTFAAAALQGSGDDPSSRALEELFRQLLGGDVPLAVLLFVIAVSPAICEEVLFRGVLLRAFATAMRPRVAVLLTALLFGAFHMSAIRFLPTASLGLLLGALAVRSGSILPSMIVHVLHNGISVLLARGILSVPGLTEPGTPPLWQPVLAGVMLCVGGVLLARSGNQSLSGRDGSGSFPVGSG